MISEDRAEDDKYPYGYWTMENGKNTKLFFDKFAEKYNFDPLAPESWYTFAEKIILEEVKFIMII